jgi:hypothetical protein
MSLARTAVRNTETRELGEIGRAYVREHLGDTNSLCAALLETFTSEPGDVFTFAPAGTPTDQLAEFAHGGLLPENLSGAGTVSLPDGSTLVPVVSLIEEQTKLLRYAMIATSGGVCIIDDFNPRWSDQASYLGPAAFGVGEEVYHLLTADHGEDDFRTAVANGNTIWHGVAAVCRVPPTLGDARTSTPSELKRCAASALLITCTAYDGEGFVAWRRRSA